MVMQRVEGNWVRHSIQRTDDVRPNLIVITRSDPSDDYDGTLKTRILVSGSFALRRQISSLMVSDVSWESVRKLSRCEQYSDTIGILSRSPTDVLMMPHSNWRRRGSLLTAFIMHWLVQPLCWRNRSWANTLTLHTNSIIYCNILQLRRQTFTQRQRHSIISMCAVKSPWQLRVTGDEKFNHYCSISWVLLQRTEWQQTANI
jgi:hypothetical protein